MTTFRIIPTILICITLLSCTAQKEELSNKVFIDLDEKVDESISITDFIEEIRIIPLETSADNMVGFVKQLEMDDENIILHDYQSIYCFDWDGKLLSKFSHIGKGPGEYLRIRNIRLFSEKKSILISDVKQKKILEYNFNGDFLREISIPGSYGHFVLLKDNNIALHISKMHSYINDSTCSDLAFLDMEGNVLERHMFHNRPLRFAFGNPFTRPDSDGTYYYTRIFDFNIYSVKGVGEPDTAFQIDYGTDAGSIDDLKGNDIEAYDVFRKSGKLMRIDGPLNVGKHLAFFNYQTGSIHMRLLNKSSMEMNHFKADSLKNFAPEYGFPIELAKDTYKDNFITVFDAVEMIEIMESITAEQKKTLQKEIPGFDLLESLDENDNPVLVFYKMKN